MSEATEHRAARLIDGRDAQVGSDPSVPRPSDTIPRPRRRIGCLLGCAGYSHDPDCSLARPMPVGPVCSLDRRCSTVGIEVLASDAYVTCPCVEALSAHAGVTR